MIRFIFIAIFLIICTANYFVTKVLKKDSNIEVNSFLERRANQKNDNNNIDNDDTDNDNTDNNNNNNDFSDFTSF
ncbi:hypothetical protein [Enterococcus casseliflavus]|uniref:hypothetical protein n=1 Tax=Enterococcus casseliflavus TaxID=37734 RepID=UPI002542A6B2|nr:hypothetical protein [Enterococcus casseliflavus]MDK4448980.1 hypothetical protein [Enterococcus casseliflavus]